MSHVAKFLLTRSFTQLNPLPNWRGGGLFVKDTEAERRVLEGKVQAAQQQADAAIREVDEAVRAHKDSETTLRNAEVRHERRECH